MAEITALRMMPGGGIITDLPDEQTLPIWEHYSALATRDAAVSGQGVSTMNDLARLRSSSIQAETEIPTARWYGSGMGLLAVGSGALMLAGKDKADPDAIDLLSSVSGGAQVAGGAMQIAGSIALKGSLAAAGTSVVRAGGIAAAPVVLWHAMDDLESDDKCRQLTGALNVAGVVAPPAAALSAYNSLVAQPAAKVFSDSFVYWAYGMGLYW